MESEDRRRRDHLYGERCAKSCGHRIYLPPPLGACLAQRLRASDPHPDGCAGAERRVPEPVRVAEQRFHPQHVLAPRGLGDVALSTRVALPSAVI